MLIKKITTNKHRLGSESEIIIKPHVTALSIALDNATETTAPPGNAERCIVEDVLKSLPYQPLGNSTLIHVSRSAWQDSPDDWKAHGDIDVHDSSAPVVGSTRRFSGISRNQGLTRPWQVALQAVRVNEYVSADINSGAEPVANRTNRFSCETFWLYVLEDDRSFPRAVSNRHWTLSAGGGGGTCMAGAQRLRAYKAPKRSFAKQFGVRVPRMLIRGRRIECVQS